MRVSPASSPLALPSLAGSPVCTREDAHGTRSVACASPCPNRSARLPRLWTEGSTGGPLSPWPYPLAGLGPSSHRSSLMAGSPGGHHRQGLSGSAFPEGLDHASGDAPWRSAATPPPLAGLSPAHGALQEHAAHVREWSTTLRAKGSLRTCIPKVFPHSSMPLHGAPSGRCKQSAPRPL